jgi:hypothetical protein
MTYDVEMFFKISATSVRLHDGRVVRCSTAQGRRSDCIWIAHGPTEALRLNRTNGPPVQCSPGLTP